MRKFTCPFCGYEHIFPPKGKSRYKKKVLGFTCPRCGKKATDKDTRKSKGKGPKPPGERRRRRRKVEERPPDIVPIIITESRKIETNDIKWRQKDQNHRPPSYSSHPSARPQRRQNQPTDRSLGEAAFLKSGIVPSGTLNIDIEHESVKKMDRENKIEEIEIATEALVEAEKKLRGVTINLSTIERKLNTRIDVITENLDKSISILSTLLSHIEKLMEEEIRKRSRER